MAERPSAIIATWWGKLVITTAICWYITSMESPVIVVAYSLSASLSPRGGHISAQDARNSLGSEERLRAIHTPGSTWNTCEGHTNRSRNSGRLPPLKL